MDARKFWIALGTLAALDVAAAAPGARAAKAQGYEGQLAAFSKRAETERTKLGLKNADDALARFPAAELALTKAANAPVEEGLIPTVSPGQTVAFELAGRVPDGALAVVDCDAVQVVSWKQTPTGIKAKLKVAAGMLPEVCSLIVASPISDARVSVALLHVIGRYRWELTLANGMTARLQSEESFEGSLPGASEWSVDGKVVATHPLRFNHERGREWIAEVERSDEENEATSVEFQRQVDSSEIQGAIKKAEALTLEMQTECRKSGNNAKACFTRYEKLVAAQMAKVDKLGKAQEEALKIHPSACHELRLTVVAGKVSGTANGCRVAGSVPVTGTVVATQ